MGMRETPRKGVCVDVCEGRHSRVRERISQDRKHQSRYSSGASRAWRSPVRSGRQQQTPAQYDDRAWTVWRWQTAARPAHGSDQHGGDGTTRGQGVSTLSQPGSKTEVPRGVKCGARGESGAARHAEIAGGRSRKGEVTSR
eukprot:6176302-Pleurochrysis_carterae.AAC.1